MALLLYLRPAEIHAAGRPAGSSRPGRHWPDLTELEDFCARWTPAWEATSDGVFLDLTGTGRLLGGGSDGAFRICRKAVSCWGELSAGLGCDPLVALLAAQLAAAMGGRLCLVPPGSEQAFLAPFSVAVLAEHFPVEAARLQQFGVQTLGDLQHVPRALLTATFGQDAGVLADAARGCLAGNLHHDCRQRPENFLVVGAAWRQPLAGSAAESALRRALTRRALLACAGGPARWHSWFLCVTWAGGSTTAVSAPGRGSDAWPCWQALIDDLWHRLPTRRQGLVALELRTGRSRQVAQQEDLFPDRMQQSRVALTEVWRQRSCAQLGFASEALLGVWNISWQTSGGGGLGIDNRRSSI